MVQIADVVARLVTAGVAAIGDSEHHGLRRGPIIGLDHFTRDTVTVHPGVTDLEYVTVVDERHDAVLIADGLVVGHGGRGRSADKQGNASTNHSHAGKPGFWHRSPS